MLLVIPTATRGCNLTFYLRSKLLLMCCCKPLGLNVESLTQGDEARGECPGTGYCRTVCEEDSMDTFHAEGSSCHLSCHFVTRQGGVGGYWSSFGLVLHFFQ